MMYMINQLKYIYLFIRIGWKRCSSVATILESGVKNILIKKVIGFAADSKASCRKSWENLRKWGAHGFIG